MEKWTRLSIFWRKKIKEIMMTLIGVVPGVLQSAQKIMDATQIRGKMIEKSTKDYRGVILAVQSTVYVTADMHTAVVGEVVKTPERSFSRRIPHQVFFHYARQFSCLLYGMMRKTALVVTVATMVVVLRYFLYFCCVGEVTEALAEVKLEQPRWGEWRNDSEMFFNGGYRIECFHIM